MKKKKAEKQMKPEEYRFDTKRPTNLVIFTIENVK